MVFFYFFNDFVIGFENPKSEIFTSKSVFKISNSYKYFSLSDFVIYNKFCDGKLSKIFASFKSLWIISIECISKMPFTICLKIILASYSVKLPLNFIRSCRLPPLQSSVIR